jgi:hypothetical protein
MTRRLDHEKENKTERARRQGTERSGADFPTNPAKTGPGRRLQKRLNEAITKIVAEFGRVPLGQRVTQADRYRKQITAVYQKEQSELDEAGRVELGPILQTEWRAGLDAIRALLPKKEAPGKERAPQQTKQAGKSKRARAKLGRRGALRKIETLEVVAEIANDRLIVNWSDFPSVDRWLLVVTKDGRKLAQLTCRSDSRRATIDAIELDGTAPLVRVYATREGKGAVATGKTTAKG